MATQSGTLKAGYQLYIDIANGDSSTVFDYTVTGASVRDNGKAWKSDRVIGPFTEDVSFSVTYTGSPSIYKIQPNGQREYMSTALPSPSLFDVGTVISVDGNAAIVSGGQIKYATPFRATWATRQAASSVMAGTELQVTDYANQKFISDGTYWRPAQGMALIAQRHGTLTTPISVLSATTSGVFTIPGGQIVIPAGMIVPNSRICVAGLFRKTGATANVFFGVKLGTAGNVDDSLVCGLTSGISSGSEVTVYSSARVGDPIANNFVTLYTIGDGSTTFSTNSTQTRNVNVDHAADQFLSLYVASGNIADTYNLISYVVWLEA